MEAKYALYALETLLDEPEHLARGRDGTNAKLTASWSCGCAASGPTTSSLEVVPCPDHQKLFDV